MIKVIGKTFTWIVISLVVIEIGLQLAHLVAKSHALPTETTWFSGTTRVLALGDSNTYGLYLEKSLSYPAQLETIWNKTHPEKKIQVINLGYPGTSSTTLRENLPKILATFKPDIVLLLAGFNDRWNPDFRSDAGARKSTSPLTYIKKHSRLYKLFYIYTRRNIDDAGFKEGSSQRNATVDEQAYIQKQMNMSMEQIIKLHKEANIQNPQYQQLQKLILELAEQHKKNAAAVQPNNPGAISELEKRSLVYNDVQFTLGIPRIYGVPESLEYLEDNLTHMHSVLNQQGIKLYLLTYGSSWGLYQPANTEIKRIADLHNLPLISSTDKLFQLCQGKSPCDEYFFGDYHPNAAGYQIIAEDLASFLDTESIATPLPQANN